MLADQLVAEILLQDRVASDKGLDALLAFWRFWRQLVPDYAHFADSDLEYLERSSQPRFPSVWDPNLRQLVAPPTPDLQPEFDKLYRRRALWQRITAILDLPDDHQAVAALKALVNGPDRLNLIPFYFSFSGSDPNVNDPVYARYQKLFYLPFRRHVLPRLR